MVLPLLFSVAMAGPDVYGFGAGADGPRTVNGAALASNTSRVTSAAAAGQSVVAVGDIGFFAIGDLVMLHQTRGASSSATFTQPPPGIDAAAIGVGQYEFARVVGINGNDLELDAPLDNAYNAEAQVVQVPEYTSLTVQSGGSLRAEAWNGERGGLLVVFVDGPLILDGAIDMSERGYRGAPQDGDPGYDAICSASNENSSNSSNKGEGVAGLGAVGRGTLGNAGGGGNCVNAGGGGGGNGGFGGRGGFGWVSDGSDDRGGFGGSETAVDYTTHLVLGGGGGAGDANNNIPETVGAAGGGLILIRARSVAGMGEIRANGGSAPGNQDDGAGGGGAGGTVVVQTLGTLACGAVEALGGDGGDVADGVIFPGAHGPGGGGGGGRVVLEGTGSCAVSVSGGAAGVFDGSNVHGAQVGEPGVQTSVPSTFEDDDNDGAVAGPDGGPDCDDSDGTVFPGANEVCNGEDDNCDGTADEGLTISTWYADDDGDGLGDADDSVDDCAAPSGYVANDSDCDDSDMGVGEASIGYADVDGDGFGDDMVTVLACALPSDFVADDTDCDDSDALVFPGAMEACNGEDDDCDGGIDEGLGTTTWYADTDADGFGDPNADVEACAQPAGTVANDDDCDDTTDLVFPGAAEACNDVDDDCDGLPDDGLPVETWYLDADSDGLGAGVGVTDCAQPSNTVLDSTDCDDTDPSVGGPTLFWFDGDFDGAGSDAQSVAACTEPIGFADNDEDCDDANPFVFPGQTESCNGIDDDCNGDADEGLPDLTFYVDADDDGFGDPDAPVQDCAAPQGTVGNDEDCDDTVGTTNPDANESCNGVDDDCNGLVDDDTVDQTWYFDGDGDGVGDASISQFTCIPPVDHVLLSGDCNDGDADQYPGNPERCDGFDQDCDGVIDEDAVDLVTVWSDSDGDGWGDGAVPLEACGPGPGLADQSGDCDDSDFAVNPDALEVCNTPVPLDDDCDGLVDGADPDLDSASLPVWFLDLDGDGYGDDTVSVAACAAPDDTYVALGGDCDDADPDVNPGAPEVPGNGIDDDCDGVADGDQPHTGDTGDTGETDTDVEDTDPELPGDPARRSRSTGCGCSGVAFSGPLGGLAWFGGIAVLGVARRRR